MPKVGASLANVSTTFIPAAPDVYLCDITQVEFLEKGGRVTVVVHNKIASGDETGAENAGREIIDRISMHKKDGAENEFGAIQLKRYAEAAIPEAKDWSEEEWDEFDTDQLQGRQVSLAVIIETYDEEMPGGAKEERKTNRIKRVLPAF